MDTTRCSKEFTIPDEGITFGYWVRRQRKALDLTQEQLAERVACAVATIKKIEIDERKPSRLMADRLAIALEIPLDARLAFLKFAANGSLEGVNALLFTATSVLKPALPRARTNLPHPTTRLIGRQNEVEQIVDLMKQPEVRLLTLSGVGGIGKSRLAYEAGRQLVSSFPDGVILVRLATVSEASLVIPSIAEVLGLREIPTRSVTSMLIDHLETRQLLLILDNFEQVYESSPAIHELLISAPGLKMLVTSRRLLRLVAERDFPVEPLKIPSLPNQESLEEIGAYPAVSLFIDRARSVKPDFRMTNENCQHVVELCHQLDGLPLAIELAAAHCRALTPLEILQRFERQLDYLASDASDLDSRHHTIRAAIDRSYAPLNQSEKEMLERLAVFSYGATFEAIEAVCSSDCGNTLPSLETLLDASLVLQRQVDSQTRYWMFNIIREFALERLEAHRESFATHVRHADYFAALSDRFLEQPARLEPELDNLRAALRWSIKTGYVKPGFNILRNFWFWGERTAEGRRWSAELLASPRAQLPNLERAWAVYAAAGLAFFQGDLDACHTLLAELLDLVELLGDAELALAYQAGMGFLLFNTGKYVAATGHFDKYLDQAIKLGSPDSIAAAHYYRGIAFALNRKYKHAAEALQIARSFYEVHSHHLLRAETTIKLGYVAFDEGDFTLAGQFFQEGIIQARAIGLRRRLVNCITGMAGIAMRKGNLEQAARMFGAAETMLRITGSRHDQPDENLVNANNLEQLRLRLDPVVFRECWRQGEELTLDQAVAEALLTL